MKCYCAFDHEKWAKAGLADFADFADEVGYISKEDGYGEWFFHETNPDYGVIYWGTYAPDHCPGSSAHTYADIYRFPEEWAAFQWDVAQLERAATD